MPEPVTTAAAVAAGSKAAGAALGSAGGAAAGTGAAGTASTAGAIGQHAGRAAAGRLAHRAATEGARQAGRHILTREDKNGNSILKILVGALIGVLLVGGVASAVTAAGFSGTGGGGPTGSFVAGNPFGSACPIPPVTQPYGPTTVIGEPIINGVRFHTGVDLACPAGTPIRSLTDGLVRVTIGFGGGFGNNVVVQLTGVMPGDSSPQTYFIRYAHLLGIAVSDGQVVSAGTVVGWEGSTGFSTGPHLHFEVDRGQASVNNSVNPCPLLSVSCQ